VSTRATAPGGAVLFVEEARALPLVSIAICLRSGCAYDPPGKDGLTRITARLLRRGADAMSAREIEEAIDRLGAELSFEIASCTVTLHAQVIRRNAAAFVDLLARLVGKPTFAEDELERIKRETIAEIIESRDNDRALAQHAFRRALFDGHPYGRSAQGTTGTIAAITRGDVISHHRRHFVRDNLVLGFAGDIDEAEAAKHAAVITDALPAGDALGDPVAEPTLKKGRHLVFVNKPERTQTQILIGTLGTSAHDPDHIALGAACAVFGGTFTSRLMREVRSKRGWSYGAYARLSLDRHRQSFSVWTFPAAADAAPCIALELDLLTAFHTTGVTPREIGFIKKYLARSHAFDIDTAPKRLHQALDVELLALPADYYSAYVAHVNAVTPEAASEAVRARLSAADLTIVVVGTADGLADAVKAAIPALESHKVVPYDDE
jgi:zinc protease